VVLGDKEAESGLVTVRNRADGDIGAMGLDELIKKLTQARNNKVIG